MVLVGARTTFAAHTNFKKKIKIFFYFLNIKNPVRVVEFLVKDPVAITLGVNGKEACMGLIFN